MDAGENSPGYASARAYLEVLSELPWSRTSSQAAAEASQGQHRSTAGDSSSSAGPSSAPPASSQAGVPLTLKQARDVLDSQHHGLDKIKERQEGRAWSIC